MDGTLGKFLKSMSGSSKETKSKQSSSDKKSSCPGFHLLSLYNLPFIEKFDLSCIFGL